MSSGGEIPTPFIKQGSPEVPTCLTGTIIALPPISHCMDGARHALHTCFQEPVRLIPTSDAAKAALNKFVDKPEVVTVCGYFRAGTECSHLEVYHVDIVTHFIAALQAANILETKTTKLDAHKVRFENKAGQTRYIWHWLNSQEKCQHPQYKCTLLAEESLTWTYGATFYIRVTSADDSCAKPTMERTVGDKDEVIPLP